MTIIFPTMKEDGLGAKRGAHFGKATFYTAVDVMDGIVQEVSVHKNPGHVTGGCANAVANIQALGADTLVVSGIGGDPLKKFLHVGIDVYFDDKNDTVEDALRDFLAGKTAKINPDHSCEHHH
ncbi:MULTISPECIES: NifB/NifX family molybdenum-iron cluster-binding protein [unclassified Sulfurospirillum]|uniref:NifB/NifX family molybdenum-iron cluster-binding protein n=1 Tax=unclassified Sulfurospirillum TaxID=2618290 RepID=UPI00050796B7|nr:MULTISPECIES: NifB/NifX family molybdenum-iron cluster-binding protein [unclassified Sulfurospirillum]KFL35164.1 dinitrogenase iron-molybdenum cofactor biosynthesis protein [Sulfurospirillum sp. SCADC]